MKAVFEGYVLANLDIEDFMVIGKNVVGTPDSYMEASTPLVLESFNGSKKIRVTVEEIV